MLGFFLKVTAPFASNGAAVFLVPFVVPRLPYLRWCLQVIRAGHVGQFAALAARFVFTHMCQTLRRAQRFNKFAGSLPSLYLCSVVAVDAFEKAIPRWHVF